MRYISNIFLPPLPKVGCQKFPPFLTPFKHLFCPHFPKSNFQTFRFSEFLGKTNRKKWSQIWILLLIKGVKSPRKKSLIFDKFCLTSRIFLVSVLLSALVERCFVSCMQDFLLDYKYKWSSWTPFQVSSSFSLFAEPALPPFHANIVESHFLGNPHHPLLALDVIFVYPLTNKSTWSSFFLKTAWLWEDLNIKPSLVMPPTKSKFININLGKNHETNLFLEVKHVKDCVY